MSDSQISVIMNLILIVMCSIVIGILIGQDKRLDTWDKILIWVHTVGIISILIVTVLYVE